MQCLTTVPLGDGQLSPGVIEHVIRGNQTLVDTFIPAIAAVLFASAAPAQAIEIEGQKGADAAPSRFSLN